MSQESVSNKILATRHSAKIAGASMRGIIVLESPRSKTKPGVQLLEAAAIISDNAKAGQDPETLRKIVRQQAALASADKRRATIAAARMRQSRRDNRPQQQVNEVKDEMMAIEGTATQFRVPAFVFDPARRQIDPFSVFPVDFNAVKDPSLLHTLFRYIVEVVSPMLDLRLPTVYDKPAFEGSRWKDEMPTQALRSAPAFWSVMAGAATSMALQKGHTPATDALTLKFRQMSIQALNSHIAGLDNSEPDLGILGAICVLGTWERSFGTAEAWHAHRRGMSAIAAYLYDGGPQNVLYTQILDFADQDGCPVAVMQSVRSDVGAVQELGIGFRELQDLIFVDSNLVNALLSCDAADWLEAGTARNRAVQNIAMEIGRYSPRVVYTEIVHRDRKRDLEGDRILLKLHLILQSAGMSMMEHMEPGLPSLGLIDIPAMCRSVSALVGSIATVETYNEILLWAMVTIWAMNPDADQDKGVEAIWLAAEKLHLENSPFGAWKRTLQRFVFLESAHEKYEQLWYRVMLRQGQQSLLNPEEIDLEYKCQIQ